jgi:hypothetical protein
LATLRLELCSPAAVSHVETSFHSISTIYRDCSEIHRWIVVPPARARRRAPGTPSP